MTYPREPRHVPARDLALYVMDALAPALKDRVEAHVFECAACAEELAHEARLEGAFERVAARYHDVVVPMVSAVDASRAFADHQRARRAWQHRAAGGLAGALAAAAAIVLALASNAPRLEPAGVVARGASRDADALQAMSAGVIGEPGHEAFDGRDSLDGG